MIVKIVTDVESGNIYDVNEVSKNHFECKIKPDVPSDYPFPDHHLYWFVMKIEGAKDQRVRIDITDCDWSENIWNYAVPVFSYSDPNTLEGMHFTIPREISEPYEPFLRIRQEEERMFKWGRIVNRFFDGKTFSFVHHFRQDEVWVAERFPYNYTYGQRYLESLEGNPHVKLEVVGKTAEGRNIDMVFVTDSKSPDEEKKGIWVYARAHAMEQDGSWVIQGMVRFLLSDDPVAATLRENAIFVFIPILAPDAAYYGRVVNPRTGYFVDSHWLDKMTEENTAIWKRVQRWIDEGKGIDVCLNFHHPFSEPEFLEVGHLSSPEGRKGDAWTFNQIVLSNWRKAGSGTYSHGPLRRFTYAPVNPESLFSDHTSKSGGHRPSLYLSSILAAKLGCISALYEINIHADGGKYDLCDYDEIGVAFVRSIFDHFKLRKKQKGPKKKNQTRSKATR